MKKSAFLTEQNEPAEVIEYLPIQEWFMKKDLKNRNHFNHSFLIRVDEKIEKERLRAALEKLSELHDMLRAAYPEGKQICRKKSAIATIKELDVKGKTAQEIYNELTGWQNRFDLEKGNLWQSGIIRGYEDGSERIYLAMHHLIIDPASWPIIREDLKNLYEGKIIEKKGKSYRQWVDAVIAYGKNASEKERRYWENIGTQLDKHRDDWTDLVAEDNNIRYTRIELSAEAMKKLLAVSREPGNTNIKDLLLSALGCALYETSGRRDNWITLETSGREDINKTIGISRTIGWFTAMYPVLLTAGNNIGETIGENKERIRKVPHNGIGYGALCGYDKLPGVLFNYLEHLGGTEENTWRICFSEASGESMSFDNRYGNIVDINGLTVEGKVRLGVESCLKEENHDRLCAAFRRNIEAVAAHCETEKISA